MIKTIVFIHSFVNFDNHNIKYLFFIINPKSKLTKFRLTLNIILFNLHKHCFLTIIILIFLHYSPTIL